MHRTNNMSIDVKSYSNSFFNESLVQKLKSHFEHNDKYKV